MKHARTKLLDISPKTKSIVWERDGHRCILCGSPYAMPNAHVIPRSQGGLGVEKNIVTLCMTCHDRMDHSADRADLLREAERYLRAAYDTWDRSELIFCKHNT